MSLVLVSNMETLQGPFKNIADQNDKDSDYSIFEPLIKIEPIEEKDCSARKDDKICKFCNFKLAPKDVISHTKLCQLYSKFYKVNEKRKNSSVKMEFQCLICFMEYKDGWKYIKKGTNISSQTRQKMQHHLRLKHSQEISLEFKKEDFGKYVNNWKVCEYCNVLVSIKVI